MQDKTKILITFQENGQNGGPYQSHKRIMECELNQKYDFVPLIVPRFRKLIVPKNARNFINDIKNSNADILHFHGLQLEGFMILLLAKIAGGVKTICALRGSTRDAIYFNPILKKISVVLENWTLRHSDICYGVSKFVANWNFVKKNAKKLYGYIYNFQDDYIFDPSTRIANRNSIRREFGIDEKTCVVISTGRIVVEKGYRTLMEIIKKFHGDENMKFIIVGGGSYLNEMREEISRIKLKDQTIFTGYRSDIGALLDASDIFISCTQHETFGNSVLEASNHKLPAIVSKVGGISEIIADNQTGFLIDPYDVESFYECIIKLNKNETMRDNMGAAALEYVNRKFERKTIENQLDDLYQTVLGK